MISYEPYDFKGHLSDFPLTLEYGKKIDALMSRYRDWLWDAEFRDRSGAKVTVAGQPYSLYSVFRNSFGKHALVIVNEDKTSEISANVELETPSNSVTVAPEHPDPRVTSANVTIPARSAVALLEQ